MKKTLEVVKKAREDMTNFAGHLLYTRWPTTELNIVGNDVHYNLGKVLRKVDSLIGALTGYLESPGGPSKRIEDEGCVMKPGWDAGEPWIEESQKGGGGGEDHSE